MLCVCVCSRFAGPFPLGYSGQPASQNFFLGVCHVAMKVTVNFGPVRVIVPCGNGDLLVRDLVDLAITRYKKASGKGRVTETTRDTDVGRAAHSRKTRG